MASIALYSFFAGIGFLDLGFEMNDHYMLVLVNEADDEFASAHHYARQQMHISPPASGYDIGNAEDFFVAGPQHDSLADSIKHCRSLGYQIGFIGGPPCPDFSNGGKNKGADGDHGRLSQVYINLICHHQPDFFLFENVKGLVQTRQHRTFYQHLRNTLTSIGGYYITDYLSDARLFGVPQHRERILLLGFSKNTVMRCGPRFWITDGVRYSVEDLRRAVWPTTAPFQSPETSHFIPPLGVIADLTVEHWFVKNDVEGHPNSHDYFQPRAGLARMQSVDEGDTSGKSFKRLHRWRFSPTAAYGNNEVHLHPYYPRRLSVAEALAIQSLPREFVVQPRASLSAKFKMVGNGVPFLLAQAVSQSIARYLTGSTILQLQDLHHGLEPAERPGA